jgi:hypothetical protein
MNIRTAWNDYFTGNPTLIQKNEYVKQQTPSATSVHVLNCLFRSITSTSDGGALSCTSVTYLLVESSSFFSCKTNCHGGAINFVNRNNGQFVSYGVCGNDCCTTGSTVGQFSRVDVQDSASSKNYIIYSSIARCVGGSSSSRYMLHQQYGKHCYQSINSSINKCNYPSGFYCYASSDSYTVMCSLSYSTFADNEATTSACLYFYTGDSKNEFKSCNIIRNKQGSLGSDGTICTRYNLLIENSCILENTATNTFYQRVSSYTITLSNCTVDKPTCNQILIIQKTVTKSFILALNHMSTQNCHSEYDSAGTLTPIGQPSPSLSPKKRIHLCTCGYLLYPYQQGNFVSLTSVLVLVFNFIYPYNP